MQAAEEIYAPFEELDLASNDISIVLGTATFNYAKSLIRINGHDLLSITPPPDGAAFPTLNGVFYDRKGSEIFRVTDNVWEGSPDSWDIEVVGTTVTIKAEEHRSALVFEIVPPKTVRVKVLDMYKDNCHIVCDDQKLLVGQVHGPRKTYIGLGNFSSGGAQVGISVDSRSEAVPVPVGISMVGGRGISIEGTGINVALGAGSMLIAQMRVWVD